MPRPLRVLLILGGVYALAWGAYVAKSAAGYDFIPYDAPVLGGHHGGWFPGSDAVTAWVRRR